MMQWVKKERGKEDNFDARKSAQAGILWIQSRD
jgi:hypothetical protein